MIYHMCVTFVNLLVDCGYHCLPLLLIVYHGCTSLVLTVFFSPSNYNKYIYHDAIFV